MVLSVVLKAAASVRSTGVPRGRGVRRVQTPILNILIFFVLRVCKICSPSPALKFIKSKILCRKTLKMYTISHFVSASGRRRPPDPKPELCPWTPLGDFRPPDPRLGPHHVNPLHCKNLGTPVVRIKYGPTE